MEGSKVAVSKQGEIKMSKLVAEANQSRHFDLVSMCQCLARNRHGDNPTELQIRMAVIDIIELLNKPVYTITVLERLQIEAELFRRYSL